MAAAEAAWPAWAAMSADRARRDLLKALEGLETDNDARTDILSRENGKIRFEAVDRPRMVFSGRFHQAAEYAPELDVDEHIAGPAVQHDDHQAVPAASSRSSTRSTGRWRSSRRPCPPR